MREIDYSKQIVMDVKSYKRAKKRKKLLYVIDGTRLPEGVRAGEDAFVARPDGKKVKRRRVRKIFPPSELAALTNRDKLSPKGVVPNEGSVGVEFAHRPGILRVLPPVLIVLCVLFVAVGALAEMFGLGAMFRGAWAARKNAAQIEQQKEDAVRLQEEAAQIGGDAALSQEEANRALLKLYQTDPDYGVLYTCAVEDGVVRAYITEDFAVALEGDSLPQANSKEAVQEAFEKFLLAHQQLDVLLDKFGVRYETADVGIPGVPPMANAIYLNDGLDTHRFEFETPPTPEGDPPGRFGISFSYEEENGDYHQVGVPLVKVDLISLTFDTQDIWDYWMNAPYDPEAWSPADPEAHAALFDPFFTP